MKNETFFENFPFRIRAHSNVQLCVGYLPTTYKMNMCQRRCGTGTRITMKLLLRFEREMQIVGLDTIQTALHKYRLTHDASCVLLFFFILLLVWWFVVEKAQPDSFLSQQFFKLPLGPYHAVPSSTPLHSPSRVCVCVCVRARGERALEEATKAK